MKKASIALTVLAFVFFVLCIVGGLLNTPPQYKYEYFLGIHPYFYLIGLGFYVIFGFIAHILVNKYRTYNNGGLLAVYILTFPAFIVVYITPFVILFALFLIVKFIDIMIDLFTGGEHGLGSVCAFLYNAAFGKTFKKKSATTDAYVVLDGGFERVLQFLEQKQDAAPNSPFYTKYYNRFRDDVGNFWRSYDNNQTFIKETVEQVSKGY